MNLNIVKESGFCHGVRAAVHKADAQRKRPVYLYGDLVNNRHVMARYIRDGFIVANDAGEVAADSTAIIRAHGVGRDVYDALAEKNVEIIDCTCVKVKAIHGIVARKEFVVIIGKKNHPEVLGISGWCENFIVVENMDELDAALAGGEICDAPCVVAQTTCNKNFWHNAVETIRARRPDAEIFDTLCDVTARRMENVAEMAKKCDCMIIVGDEKSANSVELARQARGEHHGRSEQSERFARRRGQVSDLTHSLEGREGGEHASCVFTGDISTPDKKIFFVSSPEEIANHAADILACENIGIAGSASAPVETIEAIRDFLLFAHFHADAKAKIEAASDKYFAALIAAADNPFVEAALRDLCSQNRDGKRIRGAVLMLGEVLGGGVPDAWVSSSTLGGGAAPEPPQGDEALLVPSIVSVAMAYEIFQTAILIHDDIIDKSETRRGKRTIHTLPRLKSMTRPEATPNRRGDSSGASRISDTEKYHTAESDAHFGLSRAICIGDYGLFLANRILAESGLEAGILARVFRLFSEIQIRTIRGEIMDVSLPILPVDIIKQYDEYMRTVGAIYDSKTAWYTLAGPIMLGAVCGGAGDAMLDTLREIALPLGMAFQIKDDLLGVFASEEELGKPALSDIVEKKQTILYGYAVKHADSEQRARLEKSYGNPRADAEDLQTVREIFTETGAKKFAEDEIARLSQIALDNASSLGDDAKPLVCGLVHYLITRRH
ncbi:MAG: polyprenyl synthetase family protein [Defluviitaleaceae bacterium]|nr:polyprenyl synthetase family protein [Defluviitaleaceae bacterium]